MNELKLEMMNLVIHKRKVQKKKKIKMRAGFK